MQNTVDGEGDYEVQLVSADKFKRVVLQELDLNDFTENGARAALVDQSLKKMDAVQVETVSEAMSQGILISKLESAMRIHKYEASSVVPRSNLLASYDFRDLTPKSCRVMNRLTRAVDQKLN